MINHPYVVAGVTFKDAHDFIQSGEVPFANTVVVSPQSILAVKGRKISGFRFTPALQRRVDDQKRGALVLARFLRIKLSYTPLYLRVEPNSHG